MDAQRLVHKKEIKEEDRRSGRRRSVKCPSQ